MEIVKETSQSGDLSEADGAVDCSGQLWTAVDSCGLQWTAVDCSGQLWTAVDSCGLQWIAVDCSGKLWTAVDSCGLQ